MTSLIRFVFIAGALLLFASTAGAQLQQSGGSSSASSSITSITLGGNAVTALATGELNTNVARINGIAVSTGNGVSGTGVQRVAIASDNTAFAVTATLSAGTALIGKTVPLTTCGTTAFDSGLMENIAITTGTDLTATATCVQTLYIANNTASAVTVTLKDKSGTPKSYMNAFSLPGNSNLILSLDYMKFTGGITVIAGTASAINAQVFGFQ